MKAQWLSVSVSRFHATGLVLKYRDGKGRLILLSLQWVDKFTWDTKLAWELNTGSFASDGSPNRNICSCTSAPKVWKTETCTVGLGLMDCCATEFSFV
ncbi:hypothetical protein TNCV_3334241 [Trichonephila clavipes]|nr:hypothetical protein TNCV_3334241 [Trichonephila clavipes]